MAFDFPGSPTVGQQFTPVAGTTYVWNGYAWALASSGPGLTIVPRQFTSSGPYTPTPGLVFAVVETIGAGGGGAGAQAGAGLTQIGGGGGSGGYSRRTLTAAQIGASQTITIGTPGSGGNPGTAGTATSFGTLCIANGGFGGISVGNPIGGAGGSISGAVGDVVAAGAPGVGGMLGSGANYAMSGQGGSSALGGGGTTPPTGFQANGASGSNYGSGGAGGRSFDNAGATGGAGSPGAVFITEYVGNQPIVGGGNVNGAGVPSVGQLAEWTSSSSIQGVEGRGRLVQITAQTVTVPVTLIDFTGIDSTYDEYEVHVIGPIPSANDALVMKISTDNGSTFRAGSEYQAGLSRINSAGTVVGGGSTGAPFVPFMAVNSFAALGNGQTNFIVRLFQPSMTGNWKGIMLDGVMHETSAGLTRISGHGYWIGTAAINALRFQWSVGSNFTAGIFKLYGIKK
jgi:hypothetical protein